jgi:hypothetical protein
MRLITLFVLILLTAGCFQARTYTTRQLLKEPITADNAYKYTNQKGISWVFQSIRKLDTSLQIIDMDYAPEEGFKKFISGSFVATVPEKYNEVVSLKKENKTSSDIFRKNVKYYIVLTDNKDVLNALKSLKEGKKINIKGAYLKCTLLTADNHEVEINPADNIAFVYIAEIVE